MMDQYVTFDDLLKICSILLNLASLIFYIYYNHKNSNADVACHAKRKKLTRKTKKTLLNTTFKSVFYYL